MLIAYRIPARLLSRAVAALLLTGAAGCGSSPAPAHHAAKTPVAAAKPARPTARAVSSRYVDASRSHGVEIVRPPRRLGAHETRLVNLTPDSFPVGRPRTATVGEIDVGRGLPPVGVTVGAAHADVACGTPFLATPGHGYRVRCTFTAHGPGMVTVTLTEHNAATGAAGSRFSAHARAR